MNHSNSNSHWYHCYEILEFSDVLQSSLECFQVQLEMEMEVEMIWAQKMVVAVTVESQWITAAQEVEDFEMSEHDVVAVAAAAAHDVEWQWIECSLTVVAAAALRKSVCMLGE